MPYALSPKTSNPKSLDAAVEAAVKMLSKVSHLLYLDGSTIALHLSEAGTTSAKSNNNISGNPCPYLLLLDHFATSLAQGDVLCVDGSGAPRKAVGHISLGACALYTVCGVPPGLTLGLICSPRSQ